MSEVQKEIIEIDPATQSVVNNEDLQKWLAKIKEFNQFKAEAENDIGYVATSVYNLQHIGNPMKLVMKLTTGNLDLKELGLDLDRLQKIAEKYAPQTYAALKEKESQAKKK